MCSGKQEYSLQRKKGVKQKRGAVERGAADLWSSLSFGTMSALLLIQLNPDPKRSANARAVFGRDLYD